MAQVYPIVTYEVRYYSSIKVYEVLGTYYNKGLAYGMKKKLHADNPLMYLSHNLKVITVNGQ